MSIASWLPWTDRAGRASPLKAAAFALAVAPAIYMIAQAALRELSPQPVMDLIRQSGDWCIRLLVLTLAVSPLRAICRWNRLIAVRRIFGLATFAYAVVHVCLYVIDEHFDWATVASEIVLRFYLTIGMIGVLGLSALAATSSDAAVRRLGARRWNALHRLVYVVAVIALAHYFIQLRLDASQASAMAGLVLLLFAIRLARSRGIEPRFGLLVGLAVASGLGAAIVEAGYYRLATGVDPLRVLQANLDFSYSIRPAWWVLGAGLLLALLRAALEFGGGWTLRDRLLEETAGA